MSIVDKAKEKYEQYEQQHKRIIRGAIKVFAEKNYDVGTMAMIAEEAGISEAMLYKHFDGKKELFITCFQHIVEELMGRYRECYRRNPDDPLQYLEDSAAAYLDYIKSSQGGSKYFSHLLSSTYDPELKKPLVDYFKASVDTVKAALDRARKAGDLGKDVDTEILAWDYVGQYYGLILAREMNMASMLDEARVRAFVRAMFQR
ncbi:MAG: TetR/AcrR family transcriptional regulator [Actinobacteria bacterium]|nr:TetR/AcrR family transcriptional regulator [Actinomycetota bacterium]